MINKYFKLLIVGFLLITAALIVIASDIIVKQGNLNVANIIASGNVGIGTSTPGARLEVIDSNYIGSVLFSIKADDGGPWMLNLRQDTAAQDWAFFVGNNDNLNIYDRTDSRYVMVLDGTGNVGIGTVTPGAKLDVSGTLKVSTIASQTNKVVCIKSGGVLGVCSTAISTTGVCTCA